MRFGDRLLIWSILKMKQRAYVKGSRGLEKNQTLLRATKDMKLQRDMNPATYWRDITDWRKRPFYRVSHHPITSNDFAEYIKQECKTHEYIFEIEFDKN